MLITNAVILSLLAVSTASSDVVIPLSEIWAWDMPGTKDIHKLGTKKLKVPLGTLQTGPIDMLERLKKKRAEPGFLVNGLGQVALEAAHKKLPAGTKPSNKFVEGSELSLVFFCHGLGRSCHIQNVKRKSNTVHITYHFYPRGTENLTAQVALIPLGKLPAGEYKVKFKQIALDKKLGIPPLVGVDTTLSVCQSFSFSVLARGSKVNSR